MFIQMNLPTLYPNGDKVSVKYLKRLVASVVAITDRASVVAAMGMWNNGKEVIEEPVLLVQASYDCDTPADTASIIDRIDHVAAVAAGVLKQDSVYVLINFHHHLVEQDSAKRADVRTIING